MNAFPIRFILRLLRIDRFRIDQRMNSILCHGDSNTVYEPGMVEAVAYSGGKIGRDRLLTAGDNLLFNMPEYGWVTPEPTTWKRCEKIREVAEEEHDCLSDARAVWDMAREKGCDWSGLHANHPSVEGHEVYSRVLMKLFEYNRATILEYVLWHLCLL